MQRTICLPEWWPFKPRAGIGERWGADQINALHRTVDSGRMPQVIELGEKLDRYIRMPTDKPRDSQWPRLVRASDLVPPETAAQRYEQTYKRGYSWTTYPTWSPEQKHRGLVGLGLHPTAQDVADILGNKSWTYLLCCGCAGDFEELVEMSPDDGASHPLYCVTCLVSATIAALSEEDR